MIKDKLLIASFISLLTSCSSGPSDCDGTPINLKQGQTIIDVSSPSWTECKALIIAPNGDYTIHYKNGEAYKGVYNFGDSIYEGQLRSQMNGNKIVNITIDGQGTFTRDGHMYVGEFQNGKFNGQGTYTFPGGDKHVGNYKNNMRNGKGTYTFSYGDKYVGEYRDGKMHGQGIYTLSSGYQYVGEFKDDKKHGKGTETYPQGKYSGDWKNGLRDGQGTYTYDSGEKYVGQYKNGFVNGIGAYYFLNGDIHKGLWETDKNNKKKLVFRLPNDLMLGCKHFRSVGNVRDSMGNIKPFNKQDIYLRIQDYDKNKNSGYGKLTYYQVSGFNNFRIDYQSEEDISIYDDSISWQKSMLIANFTNILNRSTLKLVSKFDGIFSEEGHEQHYKCSVFSDAQFVKFMQGIDKSKSKEIKQKQDTIKRNKI